MAGLAVILTDRNGGRKHMHVGPNHTGEHWCSVIGPEDFPIVGDDGCIDCICAPGSMSVYLPERAAEVLANDTIHYSRDAPRLKKSSTSQRSSRRRQRTTALRPRAPSRTRR